VLAVARTVRKLLAQATLGPLLHARPTIAGGRSPQRQDITSSGFSVRCTKR
jgi:hypothetical protein